jgi:hypothetical protein
MKRKRSASPDPSETKKPETKTKTKKAVLLTWAQREAQAQLLEHLHADVIGIALSYMVPEQKKHGIAKVVMDGGEGNAGAERYIENGHTFFPHLLSFLTHRHELRGFEAVNLQKKCPRDNVRFLMDSDLDSEEDREDTDDLVDLDFDLSMFSTKEDRDVAMNMVRGLTHDAQADKETRFIPLTFIEKAFRF